MMLFADLGGRSNSIISRTKMQVDVAKQMSDSLVQGLQNNGVVW
jgi:hypothetical protein